MKAVFPKTRIWPSGVLRLLARAHPLLSFRNGRALPGDQGGFPRPLHDWGRRREKKLSPRVCDSREIATLAARRQAMAVRRLYEPLCIAFGTTVSSPTVPTYQLYDLPHKFTPRLYMESEDPNLVLREIGVWAGWEQAGSANTRSFLLDLLKDEGAHGNFLLQEHGPTRFRRVRGIIVALTQSKARRPDINGTPGACWCGGR